MVVDLHYLFSVNLDVVDGCLKNHEKLCSGCTKLLAIHAKVDALSRSLQDLLEEEQELKSTLNDYHDPFANRLPIEISSSIMQFSLPFTPSLDVFDKPFEDTTHIRALLDLGLVSRNWRRISRCEPELWTILPIFIAGGVDCETNWIREWLERSGGLDSFVRLEMGVSRSLSTERIIPVILPHAHRLKVLAFDMQEEVASLILSALSSQDLSRLENLKLHLWSYERDLGIPLKLKASPSTVTTGARSLSHITFDWSRLTRIRVGSETSLYQCCQIFQNASNLTHCTLEGVFHESDLWPYDSENAIQHSSLEFLSPGTCAPAFWSTFTFPSLKTLHHPKITNSSGFVVWPSFKDFLRRSGSSLTKLVVNNYPAPSGQMLETQTGVDILTLLPNLEYFTLDGGALDKAFFSALKMTAATPDNSKFLSNLVLITLTHPVLRSSSDISELLEFANLITPRLNQPRLSLKLAEPRFAGRAKRKSIVLPKAFYQGMMDLVEAVDLTVTNRHGQPISLNKLICCDDGL